MAKKTESNNKPKRPASAYIRFTSDERKKEDGSEKTSVAEQAGKYSKKWASLKEEEKQKYIEAYHREMVEYNKAMEAYKTTDEYRESLNKKGDEKKKTSLKGKVKKPRNVSPYNVFMAELYEKKKKEGTLGALGNVASQASEEWKKMSDQNKETYQRLADEKNKARKEKEEATAA